MKFSDALRFWCFQWRFISSSTNTTSGIAQMTLQLKRDEQWEWNSCCLKTTCIYYLKRNDLLGICQALVLDPIVSIRSPAFKVASRNMLDSNNGNNSSNDRHLFCFPKGQVPLPFSRQTYISPQTELFLVILSQLWKVKPNQLSMEGRASTNEHSHGNTFLSIVSLSNTSIACIHFINVTKCAWYYSSLVNGDRILDINTEVTQHRKELPGTL